MNADTLEIMKILKCGAAHAMEVQSQMVVDFSECTKGEFRRAAIEAHCNMENRPAALSDPVFRAVFRAEQAQFLLRK